VEVSTCRLQAVFLSSGIILRKVCTDVGLYFCGERQRENGFGGNESGHLQST
jgi:hypothetical protein